MRILWASNAPWSHVSYGTQTRLILPRLAALGHEIGLFAWHGLHGGSIVSGLEYAGTVYSLPVFPRGNDAYGNDLVAQHARAWQADIVISFVDLWVLDGAAYSASAPWCPYFPLDCHPFPRPMREQLAAHAMQPIVFSRFAEAEAKAAGADARYVPLMLDSDVFTPGDRALARAALGWPEDAFLVTMVAANRGFPSRKALPEALKAFALFAKKHRDAMLYLHTARGGQPGDDGVDLPDLIERLDLRGRVQLPESYAYKMGLPAAELANVYRASDVLLSPSYGEGLGLPILEAAACGVPSIVGDWSAMPEVAFGGYRIPRPGTVVKGYGFVAQEYELPHGGNFCVPPIGSIVEALETAYRTAHAAARRDAAIAGAAAYAADTVAERYWRPVLAAIAERIGVAA